MTRRLKITLGVTIGLIVIILGGISLVIIVRFTIAMSDARFDAADARLPKIAKTASPIAAAVKKYFAIHAAYPPSLSAIRVYLPADCQVTPGGYVNGWHYVPTPGGAGFSLFNNLSHDPSLEYQWDGSVETWTFHPGDGGPDAPIIPAP